MKLSTFLELGGKQRKKKRDALAKILRKLKKRKHEIEKLIGSADSKKKKKKLEMKLKANKKHRQKAKAAAADLPK